MAEKDKDKIEEVEEVEETKETEQEEEKPEEDSKGKTFTQDEVNKMMTREKRQGVASVYKELGIKASDKDMLKAVKEFIASKKTDTQKAVEHENEVNEANRRVIIAETKAEAMQTGVQAQYVDDVVTLVLAKMESEEGLDAKTALGELKTKYPVWFEKEEKEKSKEEDKTKKGQRGTGSSIKSGSKDKDKEGTKNLGARLAANRRNKSSKKSYWS